jgi:BirA family biotin operon repressor/biotin-[acetyl-CoA-carboxylase] ligase
MNPRTEWHLDTRRVGRRVLWYESLESTNTLASGLPSDPANDGLVIIADRQTCGRGQHGRTWQCPPGAGVLLSVLLYPPPALRRPALLTAWAAVAVCDTIRQVAGLHARIKWPNDIFVRGQKVCGILIEQGTGTGAGIGLNVNQTAADLARAGLPLAGSLACFTDDRLDRDGVARVLIEQLDGHYERLCQGDWAGLEASWQERIGLLGRQVGIECLDGVRHGRLRTISFDGLEVELHDGARWRVNPESVRHIEPV